MVVSYSYYVDIIYSIVLWLELLLILSSKEKVFCTYSPLNFFIFILVP